VDLLKTRSDDVIILIYKLNNFLHDENFSMSIILFLISILVAIEWYNFFSNSERFFFSFLCDVIST